MTRNEGAEPAALWTVGHSTKPIEELIAALRAHGIEVLADIRHFPGSRKNPQYSQEPFRQALERAGIRYVHIVDLGGFRKGGYEAYMQTPDWQRGFAVLAELVAHARVAICCAEAVPFRCHRRYVARHAASLGWRVTHILDAKRTMPERAGKVKVVEDFAE
jgi:uncharacterized protein (DUF488 family)